ncbi:olfactory receptor 13G1-like [Rhineura floridana]|uniref:olfactory receptor 13G1-like n=1 Tax=Rhineura floridana TaxID=261503 RepID=UPI002AC84988|nr:olfactory receptor 13G1-like [Rhineura floridana]
MTDDPLEVPPAINGMGPLLLLVLDELDSMKTFFMECNALLKTLTLIAKNLMTNNSLLPMDIVVKPNKVDLAGIAEPATHPVHLKKSKKFKKPVRKNCLKNFTIEDRSDSDHFPLSLKLSFSISFMTDPQTFPDPEAVLGLKRRSIEIRKNQSATMEFTLVGLTSSAEVQTLLFGIFTLIYAAALVGNFLLIFIICSCRKLHTPMYFLLINLSLVNVFSISVTTPKLLQTLWTHRKTISFYGCFTQVFLFIWCLGTELFILSFMAFDRYAAICHPLQYTLIMRKEVCVGIASGVWLAGIANSAVNVGLMLKLSFCNSNIVNHFYCDIPPLLKLSCSDTSLNELMAFVADVIYGICSCGLTLTSYFFILRAILRIRSTEGKKKAFSTCSSHIIVVSFYFSTAIYTYIRPSSDYSLDKDKFVSLLYSVVTPVVNPLIYSLRNKEVKEALKTITGRGRRLQRPQD